jgi:hypothetical protein
MNTKSTKLFVFFAIGTIILCIGIIGINVMTSMIKINNAPIGGDWSLEALARQEYEVYDNTYFTGKQVKSAIKVLPLQGKSFVVKAQTVAILDPTVIDDQTKFHSALIRGDKNEPIGVTFTQK